MPLSSTVVFERPTARGIAALLVEHVRATVDVPAPPGGSVATTHQPAHASQLAGLGAHLAELGVAGPSLTLPGGNDGAVSHYLRAHRLLTLLQSAVNAAAAFDAEHPAAFMANQLRRPVHSAPHALHLTCSRGCTHT